MAADTPNFYRNEKHAKSQAREIVICLQVTGTKTSAFLPRGIDALIAYDAVTQQVIDDYLTRPFDGYTSSSSTGFTASQFDATAMGANVIGGVVNMNQQAAYVSYMSASFATGGTTVTQIADGATGLPASTLSTAVGISPAGDIGFRAILTGLDAATSGVVVIRIGWISK